MQERKAGHPEEAKRIIEVVLLVNPSVLTMFPAAWIELLRIYEELGYFSSILSYEASTAMLSIRSLIKETLGLKSLSTLSRPPLAGQIVAALLDDTVATKCIRIADKMNDQDSLSSLTKLFIRLAEPDSAQLQQGVLLSSTTAFIPETLLLMQSLWKALLEISTILAKRAQFSEAMTTIRSLSPHLYLVAKRELDIITSGGKISTTAEAAITKAQTIQQALREGPVALEIVSFLERWVQSPQASLAVCRVSVLSLPRYSPLIFALLRLEEVASHERAAKELSSWDGASSFATTTDRIISSTLLHLSKTSESSQQLKAIIFNSNDKISPQLLPQFRPGALWNSNDVIFDLIDSLRMFSHPSLPIKACIEEKSHILSSSEIAANILSLAPLINRAIDSLIRASVVLVDESLSGGYSKTVISSESNLGKDLLHRIALDAAQVHMREMILTTALFIELGKLRLFVDILLASCPSITKEDGLHTEHDLSLVCTRLLSRVDEAKIDLFKRMEIQEKSSKTAFDKAVTSNKNLANIWRIYATSSRCSLYFSAAKSSLYCGESIFRSARDLIIGLLPSSLTSKSTVHFYSKLDSMTCVSEARSLLSTAREFGGESHRAVICIESGRLEECIGNKDEAKKRYEESFSIACSIDAAASGRASSGIWRTCSSFVSFELRNGNPLNAIRICLVSISSPGCSSSGRLWAYLAQSVSTLTNDDEIVSAEDMLSSTLFNALNDEDTRKEKTSIILSSIPTSHLALSVIQSLLDFPPFSYKIAIDEYKSDASSISINERRHFLLTAIVRCGFIYAPKSGELWTEAGRVLLYPMSRYFSRSKAVLCFKRACDLTQQYGDAFIERIRATIFLNKSNVSLDKNIENIEDVEAIIREASASSPNYGPSWTALSPWVAFESRETSFALMSRAKRLIQDSFHTCSRENEKNAPPSALSIIFDRVNDRKEKEQKDIGNSFLANIERLSKIYCDDLS
jgi:hypothetical protein